jgi:quercetin dioxygenase-like cupin family protein
MRSRRMSGAAGLMALSAAVVLSAQAPVIVPVEREPQHHPVFRNDIVSVLDVRLPPGYASRFHTHAHDNVSVRIATGPLRIDTLTARGTPQTAEVGRVAFNAASPPYTHRVVNVGSAPIHILDIEVLATTPTPVAGVTDDLARHEGVIDNDRVRAMRIVLPPGATMAAHTHRRGWLEVEVRGPSPGTYRWYPAGETRPAVAAPAGGLELVEVEVK